MEAIQQTSSAYDSIEEAQDALFALTHLPGYLFGYVDEAKLRTVSFHKVEHPVDRTFEGQKKVVLAFAASPAPSLDFSLLTPIGKAIAASAPADKPVRLDQADADGWSRAQPTANGRWLWREDHDREAVELTLTSDGREVAACGDAEEGTPQFYWELTATTQQLMPGLWKRLQ